MFSHCQTSSYVPPSIYVLFLQTWDNYGYSIEDGGLNTIMTKINSQSRKWDEKSNVYIFMVVCNM